MVQLSAPTGADELSKELEGSGLRLRKMVVPDSVYLIALLDQSAIPDVHTLELIRNKLEAISTLSVHSEPDYIVSNKLIPNDSNFNRLWGMTPQLLSPT